MKWFMLVASMHTCTHNHTATPNVCGYDRIGVVGVYTPDARIITVPHAELHTL
jgi:hypothetical protein